MNGQVCAVCRGPARHRAAVTLDGAELAGRPVCGACVQPILPALVAAATARLGARKLGDAIEWAGRKLREVIG